MELWIIILLVIYVLVGVIIGIFFYRSFEYNKQDNKFHIKCAIVGGIFWVLLLIYVLVIEKIIDYDPRDYW